MFQRIRSWQCFAFSSPRNETSYVFPPAWMAISDVEAHLPNIDLSEMNDTLCNDVLPLGVPLSLICRSRGPAHIVRVPESVTWASSPGYPTQHTALAG
jgi:hypothetical protein